MLQVVWDDLERSSIHVNEDSVCSHNVSVNVRIKIMSTSKSWGFRAYTLIISQRKYSTWCNIVHPLGLSGIYKPSEHVLGCWHWLFQWFPLSYCTVLLLCCLFLHIFGVWLAQNAHIFFLLMRLIFFLFWVIISSFILSSLYLISISFWLVCMFKRRSVGPRICRQWCYYLCRGDLG